jgi:hypothetical protein
MPTAKSGLSDRGGLQVFRMIEVISPPEYRSCKFEENCCSFSEAPWKISLRQQLLIRKILTNLSPEIMDFI